jgi:hypothetical protein
MDKKVGKTMAESMYISIFGSLDRETTAPLYLAAETTSTKSQRKRKGSPNVENDESQAQQSPVKVRLIEKERQPKPTAATKKPKTTRS